MTSILSYGIYKIFRKQCIIKAELTSYLPMCHLHLSSCCCHYTVLTHTLPHFHTRCVINLHDLWSRDLPNLWTITQPSIVRLLPNEKKTHPKKPPTTHTDMYMWHSVSSHAALSSDQGLFVLIAQQYDYSHGSWQTLLYLDSEHAVGTHECKHTQTN